MGEQNVISRLAEAFPSLDVSEAAVSPRRIFLYAPGEIFLDALRFACDELGFTHLCTITGLDTGEGYEFIYHVSDQNGVMLNLKLKTAGGDGVVIQSVLPIYNGAVFYERELEGLLGVKVEGLTEGRQYPLPDNWPEGQYPMRKEWRIEN